MRRAHGFKYMNFSPRTTRNFFAKHPFLRTVGQCINFLWTGSRHLGEWFSILIYTSFLISESQHCHCFQTDGFLVPFGWFIFKPVFFPDGFDIKHRTMGIFIRFGRQKIQSQKLNITQVSVKCLISVLFHQPFLCLCYGKSHTKVGCNFLFLVLVLALFRFEAK